MFHKSVNLKDISDLQYLDIRESKDLLGMFCECPSLSDIAL